MQMPPTMQMPERMLSQGQMPQNVRVAETAFGNGHTSSVPDSLQAALPDALQGAAQANANPETFMGAADMPRNGNPPHSRRCSRSGICK